MLKVGAYVNTEFFGLLVVPFYGLIWNINSRLTLQRDIPIWAKLNYNATKKVDMGFSYFALRKDKMQ